MRHAQPRIIAAAAVVGFLCTFHIAAYCVCPHTVVARVVCPSGIEDHCDYYPNEYYCDGGFEENPVAGDFSCTGHANSNTNCQQQQLIQQVCTWWTGCMWDGTKCIPDLSVGDFTHADITIAPPCNGM